MSKPEILEKIDDFLKSKLPFDEECQIVYCLVEIRKILDRDDNRKYPLLRFYCDWSVHTAKDRITKEMKRIMEKMYKDIYNSIINPKLPAEELVNFIYMNSLQDEVGKFLYEYALPTDLVVNRDYWLSFVSYLVQILSDQPINKPCKEISTFQFLPVRQGSVRGVVVFSNPIDEQRYFEYIDTY